MMTIRLGLRRMAGGTGGITDILHVRAGVLINNRGARFAGISFPDGWRLPATSVKLTGELCVGNKTDDESHRQEKQSVTRSKASSLAGWQVRLVHSRSISCRVGGVFGTHRFSFSKQGGFRRLHPPYGK